MCTLTKTPPRHSMFKSEYSWDSARPSLEPSRPRAGNMIVSLPSIRETFPELRLDGSLREAPANSTPVLRPTSTVVTGSQDTSEYVPLPSFKRRQIAIDDQQSTLRAKQACRLYSSPERPVARHLPSPHQEQTMSAAPVPWTKSPLPSLYREVVAHVPKSRSALPPMPPPANIDRGHDVPMRRLRDPTAGVIYRAPTYQTQDYPHPCQHPNRYRSVSSGPVREYDRAPFSARAGYGPQCPDAVRYGSLRGMGMGADAKQRKRRWNLTKEMTDKLRAWFAAHLDHPYPTEDEKHELMRQTGLRIDQISKWFINARRRQLPAIILAQGGIRRYERPGWWQLRYRGARS